MHVGPPTRQCVLLESSSLAVGMPPTGQRGAKVVGKRPQVQRTQELAPDQSRG